MRVKWGIEDGYAGRDRPQHVDVPDDDLAECETFAEVEELVDGYVEEEKEQMPTFWSRDPVRAAWEAQRSEKA